jgi:hypothetical protein
VTQATITYSSVIVKQQIEVWGEGLEFDPEEQVIMLLEDKFGPSHFNIADARPEQDCMILIVESNAWEGPKEFALLKSGSLAW